MPITLITGTPGAGKTLYAVKKLVEELVPSGRQIFVNINGLDVPNENVHPCDDETPMKWMDYPDGSIFIFDEVQRQYPFKNAMSKVPDYITAYETHRHRGMDFYFITQGPHLLERHLFPLIDRHFHIYRPFGLKRSTVLEWNGVNPTPAPRQSRTNAMIKSFNFPKKYFSLYKSATVHTVKMRVPWKLVIVVGLVFAAFLTLGIWGFFKFSGGGFMDPTKNGLSDPQKIAAGGDDVFDLTNPMAKEQEPPAPLCASLVASSPSSLHFRYAGRLVSVKRLDSRVTDSVLLGPAGSGLSVPLCGITESLPSKTE